MSARRNWPVVLVALAIVTLLAGCGPVKTMLPLPAAGPPADKDQWEGTWTFGGEAGFDIHFTCDGVGHTAGAVWNEDHFELSQGEIIVAEGKRTELPWMQMHFLSVRWQENGTWDDSYYLARYEFGGYFGDSSYLLVWLAQPSAFQQAIESGRLRGEGTLIFSTPKEILAFIDDPENMALFDYEHPIIIRRLAPAPPPPQGVPPATCEKK